MMIDWKVLILILIVKSSIVVIRLFADLYMLRNNAFLAENDCFHCIFGHFHLNMTYLKEKYIVNCAGKYKVSAKEINHA